LLPSNDGKMYLGALPGLNARLAQDPGIGIDTNLLAQGSNFAPVRGGIAEGLARALSGVAGGYLMKRDMVPYIAAEGKGTDAYNKGYTQWRQDQQGVPTALASAMPRSPVGGVAGALTGTQVDPQAWQPPTAGMTGVSSPGDVTGGAGLVQRPLTQGAPSAPMIPTNPTGTPAPAPAGDTGSTSSQGSGGSGLNGYIVNFFTNKGYTPEQARGIAAGIQAESGSDPNAFNSAGGGSGAMGLGQWRGSRQTGLRAMFGDNPTMDQQLEYVHKELQGGDPGGASVLAAQDAPSVLNAFVRNYMRPGPEGARGDIRRGQQALGMGVTGGTGNVAVGGVGPDGKPISVAIPTAPHEAVAAAPPPPTAPTPIPLPDRVQSSRLSIADNILANPSMAGNSALAYMVAQPTIEQGLTEDQAAKMEAYRAAAARGDILEQSQQNLYNTEAAKAYAQPFDERTAALAGNRTMDQAQYGAQIAQGQAAQKFGYDTSLKTQEENAAIREAQIRADAANFKVPPKIRDRWGQNNASIQAVDDAIKAVQARPQSFSVAYGAMGPEAANKVDPDGATTRAMVQRVASQVEVAAGGVKAMAPGEQAIFARYNPSLWTSAKTVTDLLGSQRDYTSRENQSYENTYGKDRLAPPDNPYAAFINSGSTYTGGPVVAGNLPGGGTVSNWPGQGQKK
jgi:hypothetical protein